MSEEEVALIYDYLHANYVYRDGELYLKHSLPGHKKNHRIGSMTIPEESKGYAHLMTSFYINKKPYPMPLSHAVFIYHNKIKPEYILFKNKNRMDVSIENLQSVLWKDVINSRDYELCQGYKYDDGRYRVCIRAADYEGSLGAYGNEAIAKEIYLLAKGLLRDNPLTINELREKLVSLHPKAKAPYKIKRILPFAYENKQGNFDSKMTFKSIHSLYFGSFDTPLEAHYAAMDFKEEFKKDPSVIELYKNKIKNKSGYKNVYENNKSIFAIITIKKKKYTLGPFSSKDEAHQAQLKAKETGVFEVYDGNKIIKKKCSLCDEIVEIKQKCDHMKKYCMACKKQQMKTIDANRRYDKKHVSQLSREGFVYIFGYFNTKEEAKEVAVQKASEYKTNKEYFILNHSPSRKQKQISKEEQKERYIKHRLKHGKPIKETTIYQTTDTIKRLKGAHKSGNKFTSSAFINGKNTYLGTFLTEQEAHEAYLKAKQDHAKNS